MLGSPSGEAVALAMCWSKLNAGSHRGWDGVASVLALGGKRSLRVELHPAFPFLAGCDCRA